MQQDGDDVQAGEERQQQNGFEDDLQRTLPVLLNLTQLIWEA